MKEFCTWLIVFGITENSKRPFRREEQLHRHHPIDGFVAVVDSQGFTAAACSGLSSFINHRERTH